MKPYLLISDIHFHNWNQFATINDEGINSRLQQILDAFGIACNTLFKAGGKDVILAGDVFHVRGSLTPSVVNPVKKLLQHWSDNGLKFYAIDGNHDLESKDSERMKSAIEVLDAPYFAAIHRSISFKAAGINVTTIPWCHDLDEVREVAINKASPGRDLIIHAPMNGVIKGIPDTGLDPAEVAAWGYNRVFCGHYHNAISWDDKVFSIGALTHQTWSDVNSTAGYWLVYPDRAEHFLSPAPKFVDYDMSLSGEECMDNYVRVTLNGVSEGALKVWREHIEKCGALGSIFRVTPEISTSPRGSVASSSKTIEESISDWIADKYPEDHLEVTKKALILLGASA